MHFQTIARLSLALTAVGLAPVAHAGTTMNELPQVLVSYHDLDLSQRGGVVMLDKRIRKAARKVCMPEGNASDNAAVIDCMRKAIVSARPQRKVAIARAEARVATPVMATLDTPAREP